MWPDAHTLAAGLRVPKAYGDFIILDIVRKSCGTAVAVSDDAIMDGVKEMASTEGIFPAPEGAAGLVAYKQLLQSGFLTANDKVVLFNTGSGYKYLDVFANYWVSRPSRQQPNCRPHETLAGLSGHTSSQQSAVSNQQSTARFPLM